MRESSEPMEFGTFDFYKVLSRAFVKGVMGQLGFEWKPGDVILFIIYWDYSENRRECGGTQRKTTHLCASMRPLR